MRARSAARRRACPGRATPGLGLCAASAIESARTIPTAACDCRNQNIRRGASSPHSLDQAGDSADRRAIARLRAAMCSPSRRHQQATKKRDRRSAASAAMAPARAAPTRRQRRRRRCRTSRSHRPSRSFRSSAGSSQAAAMTAAQRRRAMQRDDDRELSKAPRSRAHSRTNGCISRPSSPFSRSSPCIATRQMQSSPGSTIG